MCLLLHWQLRGLIPILQTSSWLRAIFLSEEILSSYKLFKKIVPSKAEEKRIGREFEIASGYSLYRAVQAAKQKEKGTFSLGKEI